MHTKALLLVDYDQPQATKLHVTLKQCVSTDHYLNIPVSDLRQYFVTLGSSMSAGKPNRFNVEWLQPATKTAKMLLGQQLSGRQHWGLNQLAFE